jgi:phosphoadenosine phosphosulfate reductase
MTRVTTSASRGERASLRGAHGHERSLEKVSDALRRASPKEVLRWAARRFAPRIAFATGFGPEGLVLLDLIGRERLEIDVFTLDTGLLFPETYRLWRRLEERYGTTIRAVRPGLDLEGQAQRHGAALWEREPDRCCRIRKVEPLAEALGGRDAWISAIRSDQTRERAAARVVEIDDRFGLVKVNPLLGWSSEQVWAYLREHDVPTNPLHERGYPSIGCWPCTSPTHAGEDPRFPRKEPCPCPRISRSSPSRPTAGRSWTGSSRPWPPTGSAGAPRRCRPWGSTRVSWPTSS